MEPMHSALKCPACQSSLKPEVIAGITLDLCPQCGGCWLDNGETQSLVHRFSQLSEIPYLDLRTVFQHPRPPHPNPQRRCRRCNVIMDNINYARNSNILVDPCPRCHGLWTDAGKLAAMVQYVKGNPKLDRLAFAIADHVRHAEERCWSVENMRMLARTSLWQDFHSRIAILVAVLIEAIRQMGKRD